MDAEIKPAAALLETSAIPEEGPSPSAAEIAPAPLLPILRVEATKGWVSLRLREIWTARGLLYFLVWRDVKVRYKQTVLGAAWAILQPVMAMIIFSIFFGRLAKMPSAGVPYPIFAYAGLVPWQFFSLALTESSNSLVNNKSLITKIYFPRVVIPCAGIFAALVDFTIALVVLAGMMVYFGIAPTPRLLVVPVLVAFVVVTALAAGLWLSALNVKYRDVRYLIAIPDPVLAVCDAHRVLERPGAAGLSRVLRAESHGRRGRGVSLGGARHPHQHRIGDDWIRDRRRRLVSDRSRLFSSDRKILRRSGLRAP